MRNIIKNIALSYGTDMLIVLIAFATALPFLNPHMANSNFIIFFFIFWLAFLPLINFLHDAIDSRISPIHYEDLFSKTVDAILTMKSLDAILKETFVQILDFIRVPSGLLLFYYPDRDEYSIFYQKDRRRKMIRNARIENNNAIFRALKSPDDILIKSKLSSSTEFEYALIREMEKLHAETIVPIFFRDTFLGAIVTGKRNRKFSARETALLKIFASKIAILSINNYFLSELLKKKEIEKEYELASTIHNRFLPEHDIKIGPFEIRIHHRTKSLSTREFFDIFENRKEAGCIHMAAYSLRGDIAGTSIYMPGIHAHIHSISRIKNSPKTIITKLIKSVSEREIIDEDPAIFIGTITSRGSFKYCCAKYPAPFVFQNKKKGLIALPGAANTEYNVALERGDIILLCSANIHQIIEKDLSRFNSILRDNKEETLSKTRSALVRALSRTDEGDTLLFLVRFGVLQ